MLEQQTEENCLSSFSSSDEESDLDQIILSDNLFDSLGVDVMINEIFPHFEIETLHSIFTLVSKFWYGCVCLYRVESLALKGESNIKANCWISPRMMQVQGLELRGLVNGHVVRNIFDSKGCFPDRFSSLTSLSFYGSNIGNSLKYLTQTKLLPNLTELDLYHNNVTNEGMKLICEGNLKLSILKLNLNSVGDLGLEYLKDSEILRENLKVLELTDNEITSNGLNILSEMPNSCLETLILVSNKIESNISKFCSSPLASQLKYLNLSSNKLGYSGALDIRLGNFNSLETLILSMNEITIDALMFLIETNSKGLNLKNLKGLDLFGNDCLDIDFDTMDTMSSTRDDSLEELIYSKNYRVPYSKYFNKSKVNEDLQTRR